MDALNPRELLSLREFLRVLRQLEAAGLGQHVTISVTLRGRNVDVSARVLAGGASLPADIRGG